MSTFAEFRAERRADRALAAQLELARESAVATERRADQMARERAAAARRQERRATRKAWWASLPGRGMDALWATMIVLPITLAWNAQARFAEQTLHIAGGWSHLFPAAIECGAWVCVFEARRRLRRGDSAGSLPFWMWVLAGIAAVINAAHGIKDGGVPAGLALAALSLLGVLLHSIRHRLDAAEHAGGAERMRLALWRRLRYPLLSLSAASIRAARELDTATAWRLAWEDRYGVGPDATRRERQLAKAIVARTTQLDREAAAAGEITIVAGHVQHGFTDEVKEFVDAERSAAMDLAQTAAAKAREVVQGAHDALMAAGLLFGPDQLGQGFAPANPAGTTPELANLSQRAAEVLPDLRTAIAAGRVPANPSVNAIRNWVREDRGEPLGVPTAQELRDTVRSIHVIDPDDDEIEEATA